MQHHLSPGCNLHSPNSIGDQPFCMRTKTHFLQTADFHFSCANFQLHKQKGSFACCVAASSSHLFYASHSFFFFVCLLSFVFMSVVSPHLSSLLSSLLYLPSSLCLVASSCGLLFLFVRQRPFLQQVIGVLCMF